VQIDRLVNQFLSAVRSKQATTASAEKLYQMLLVPVMAERRPSSLIVVPDGSLHLIPFAALVDANGTAMNKYLAVGAVPSATVYSILRNTVQQTKATRPFLGMAYSPAEKEKAQTAMTSRGIFEISVTNLKPLQFGREEIVEAAHLLGEGSVALYGAAASEAALKAQTLRDFKVLHFAAHGIGNEAEPDRAALVLTAGSPSEDGLWQSREIRLSRLNADLVVLSACETGTGFVQFCHSRSSLAICHHDMGNLHSRQTRMA
jgi:CHAT domain-containing protein